MVRSAISQIDNAIEKLQLTIAGHTNSNFATKSNTTIVEDTYKQVVPGLHVRKISINGLHESELQFAPKINAILKRESGEFVAMKFSSGAVLGEHFHLHDVHFICLSGAFSTAFNTDGSGTIIRAGSELLVPADTVHKFIGIENGLVVAIFKK